VQLPSGGVLAGEVIIEFMKRGFPLPNVDILGAVIERSNWVYALKSTRYAVLNTGRAGRLEQPGQSR